MVRYKVDVDRSKIPLSCQCFAYDGVLAHHLSFKNAESSGDCVRPPDFPMCSDNGNGYSSGSSSSLRVEYQPFDQIFRVNNGLTVTSKQRSPPYSILPGPPAGRQNLQGSSYQSGPAVTPVRKVGERFSVRCPQ